MNSHQHFINKETVMKQTIDKRKHIVISFFFGVDKGLNQHLFIKDDQILHKSRDEHEGT